MAESGGEQARRARKAVVVVALSVALVFLACAWDWGGMCGVGSSQEAARAADWVEGQAGDQVEGQTTEAQTAENRAAESQTAGSQMTENWFAESQTAESRAAESQAAEGSGSLLGAWRHAMAGKSAEEILAEEGYCVFSVEEASEVPTWFEQELLPLDAIGSGVATQDWGVVGFFAEGPTDEVVKDLCSQLAMRGWLGYESGEEGLATFTKEGGVCSWAMVSCVPSSEGTCVVIRVRHA